MAHDKSSSLPNETGLELMNKILRMCWKKECEMSEIFHDHFVSAIRLDYGDQVVRKHIHSMVQLGLLRKEGSAPKFKCTERGLAILGKQTI